MSVEIYSRIDLNNDLNKVISKITSNFYFKNKKNFYKDKRTSKFFQIKFNKEHLNKGVKYLTAEIKWVGPYQIPYSLDNLFTKNYFQRIEKITD